MAARRRTGWLLAGLLVVASAAARFAVARGVDAPWIAPDETIYALLGRALWSDGSLSLLGEDAPFYSLVYPALIGLPLSVFGPSAGLAAVQAMQAVAMSAVALVVFAWGRGLVGDRWALVAATLSVLIPGLSYTGFLMSETAFYLVVTLALWALWRVLVLPSPRRQAVLVVAIAAAVLTRVQALALIPAVLLAIALFCGFSRQRSALRRLAPTLLVLLCGSVVVLVGAAATGGWRSVVGAYAAAAGGYEPLTAAEDVVWHAGGVFLVVGGVPLVALGVLALQCARRGASSSVAALVATALAWTLVTVVEVGVFASEWVGHMAERQLLTVAPPLFLVLAVWVARGAYRPQPATAIIALLVVAPALLLPIARFATQEAALDAFTFIPLWRLQEATSSRTLQLVYSLLAATLVLVAVFVPRRARLLLVAVVAAMLASTSVLAAVEIDRLTAEERRWVFAADDPGWIDETVDAPVTYVHAGTTFPAALWKTLFWNERIERVLRFADTPAPGPLPAHVVALQEDGSLSARGGPPSRGAYVVAPAELVLEGQSLASYGPAVDLAGLTLWRADAPLHVRWVVTGAQPNGDVVGVARIDVLGCTRGRLELTLLGKARTKVELLVDGREERSVAMAPNTVWNGTVPSPGRADGRGRCVFAIRSTGLVGATRIEFVRA